MVFINCSSCGFAGFLFPCALCSFLLDTSTQLLQAFLLKVLFSGMLHRAPSHLSLCPVGGSMFEHLEGLLSCEAAI